MNPPEHVEYKVMMKSKINVLLILSPNNYWIRLSDNPHFLHAFNNSDFMEEVSLITN